MRGAFSAGGAYERGGELFDAGRRLSFGRGLQGVFLREGVVLLRGGWKQAEGNRAFSGKGEQRSLTVLLSGESRGSFH